MFRIRRIPVPGTGKPRLGRQIGFMLRYPRTFAELRHTAGEEFEEHRISGRLRKPSTAWDD